MEYVIQKLLENVIKRSLFHRTSIEAYVQVVCDDGSLLSTIINSVMLALDDSEIPISNKFASVCLLLSPKGDILPDPCKEEEEESVWFTTLYDSRFSEVLQSCITRKVKL